MRTIVVAMLMTVGCERQETVERLAPPGPERLEVLPAPLPPPAPPVVDAAVRPDELAEILAILQGKGAVDPKRAASPNLQLDPSWDPRQTWLSDYEKLGRNVTLKGEASSPSDITQFAKRLAVHPMFDNLNLVTSSRTGELYPFVISFKSLSADPDAPEVHQTFRKPTP